MLRHKSYLVCGRDGGSGSNASSNGSDEKDWGKIKYPKYIYNMSCISNYEQ